MKRCPQCKLFCTDEAPRCDCGHVFEGQDGVGDAALEPLEREVRQGARWFYWIAGLSVVNSVFSLFGIRLFFLIGLDGAGFFTGLLSGLFGLPVPNLEFELALVPIYLLEILIALTLAGVGYAASRGLGVAFVVGAAVYAADGILCFVDGQFLSLAFHALALTFVLKGYIALRRLRKEAIASRRPWRPAQRPLLLYGLVAAPLCAFIPVFIFSALFSLVAAKLWDMMESVILVKAPAEFTADDRERLHRAYAAVEKRFERDGRISYEEAAQMNGMAATIIDKPAAASREDLLELIEILESIGGVTGGSAAVFENRAYQFSYPPPWSVRSRLEDTTASEVLLAYRDQATIGLRVDSLPVGVDARVSRSPDRLADSLKIESCQQEWTISDWGSYKGHGRVYQCTRADEPVRFKFFASSLGDDRYLEHYQVYPPEAETSVYEADNLVLQTLEIER